MNIKLNVNGSLLTRESAQYAWVEGAIEIEKRKSLKLSQYTWGVDFLEFEFDEAWDDYAKFAMFVQNEQVVKVEIEDYKALIPTQFTGAIEPIKLMVYGRGEGQITTNTLQLTIVTTLDPDTPAGEPTQGLFYIQTENVSQLRINEAGTGLEFKDGEIWKGFPDLSPLLTRLDTLEADNAKLKAYRDRKWELIERVDITEDTTADITCNFDFEAEAVGFRVYAPAIPSLGSNSRYIVLSALFGGLHWNNLGILMNGQRKDYDVFSVAGFQRKWGGIEQILNGYRLGTETEMMTLATMGVQPAQCFMPSRSQYNLPITGLRLTKYSISEFTLPAGSYVQFYAVRTT